MTKTILILKKFVKIKQFDQLSEVMHLHITHLWHILLRMDVYTRAEYKSKMFTEKSFLYYNGHIMSKLNRLTIILGFAMFLKYMPTYSSIMGAALGVSHYDRFSLMATTSFIFLEYLWSGAFDKTVQRKDNYAPLDLLYEYEEKLDTEIDPLTKRHLLLWYSKAHWVVITYLHFVWSAIAVQCMYITVLIVQHGLVNCDNPEVQTWIPLYLLYIFFAVNSNFLGAYSVVISSTFYTDLFFLVKIFKYKLVKCFACLQVLRQSLNPVYLHRFDHGYMSLHRQLNGYNDFTQKLIYICDLIFKCAGSITFSFFAAQRGAEKNRSIVLLITVMFIVSYAGLQLVFTYLAYFPEENLRAFKAVSSISARNGVRAVHNTQYRSNGSYLLYNGNNSIRCLSKINIQTQFLANNKFAFTYTSHYCIQKIKIIENVFANFYFFILFFQNFV